MATKTLGESFLGTGALSGSAQVDSAALGGAWATWIGTAFADGSSTFNGWNRSNSGAVLAMPGSDTGYYTARLNGFSLVRGAGTLVLEVSAYGPARIAIETATDQVYIRGAGSYSYRVSGTGGTFTSVGSDLTILHKFRIEVEADTTRFYVDGALVGTVAQGLSASDAITGICVAYFRSASLAPTLLIDYLNLKSETASGSLGRAVAGPPLIPISWLATSLSGSGQINATGEGDGYWVAQDVSPTAGFTAGNVVRTNGGVVFTPSLDAFLVGLEWRRSRAVNDFHANIESGYTYVRLAFYGNPTVTLGMTAGVDGPAFQIQVQPTSLSAALVGVSANTAPNISALLSTGREKRTLLVFRLDATGLAIYADNSGTAIYSDTTAYGVETRLRSIGLEWAIAPVKGAMFSPGTTTPRALDWAEFEQGIGSGAALFESIPAQPGLPVPYVAAPGSRVAVPKIYGKYTIGGKKKLIVPPGTTVKSAANYGVKPSNVTTTATLTTTTGSNVNLKANAPDSINITMPVLLSDAIAGPGMVAAQQSVIADPEHLTRTAYGPTPRVTVLASSGFQDPNDPLTKAPPDYAYYSPPGDSNENGYTTQVRGSKYVVGGEWLENLDISHMAYTGRYFYHWEHKPNIYGTSYNGWTIVYDGVIPGIRVPAVLTTVPATYAITNVLVPGPDIRTLRSDLTINALVLPEDITSETVSFEVAFTGAGPRATVADGPADGEAFDSIVVANNIPPSTIKRLNITLYPDYVADRPAAPAPALTDFWTAFKASHEVPANLSAP